MAKFDVTGEQDIDIDKKMLEIKRQLRQKGGSPLDPELVNYALQDIIEGKFYHNKKDNPIFYAWKGIDPIIIHACNGTKTLVDVRLKDALDFQSLSKDESKNLYPNNSTKSATLEIYRTIKKVDSKSPSYAQIFRAFKTDLDNLCLTQHQIKIFIEKYLREVIKEMGYTSNFNFICRSKDGFEWITLHHIHFDKWAMGSNPVDIYSHREVGRYETHIVVPQQNF